MMTLNDIVSNQMLTVTSLHMADSINTGVLDLQL